MKHYRQYHRILGRFPNRWDFGMFILVCSVLYIIGISGRSFTQSYHIGEKMSISLHASSLFFYLLLTLWRIIISMAISIIFSIVIGTLAAKHKTSEKIIIPCLDILQSVPVLGFLSLTISGFIQLFYGSRLGPECAAVFAIFTAQVWNICLSFYYNLKLTPPNLIELAKLMGLSTWKIFWKIEFPVTIPHMIWNITLSFAASWIFIIPSEVFSCDQYTIQLPGIGSYLNTAYDAQNYMALGMAISAIFVVIILFEQFLFQPLKDWAQKFSIDNTLTYHEKRSWFAMFIKRTRWFQAITALLKKNTEKMLDALQRFPYLQLSNPLDKCILCPLLFKGALFVLIVIFAYRNLPSLCQAGLYYSHFSMAQIIESFGFGLLSLSRVIIVILIACLIWIPIGVWIGMNYKIRQFLQPIINVLISFPVNVFFPFIATLALQYHFSRNAVVIFMILLSTQWYILFNVIAGAALIQKDLYQMMQLLGVKKKTLWLKLILPSISTPLLTALMTAAGNAWNMTVITEYMFTNLGIFQVKGLGQLITLYSEKGETTSVAFNMIIMVFIVLIVNYVLWRPLHQWVLKKYSCHKI